MARGCTKLKYLIEDKERYPKKDETRREGDVRSCFEVDRSRIIHSSSFRRLQGKTQVFSPGEGDFYRNRLTHSLEVAQIGKGLALRLGADTDLVETLCLAHDLGHPPFGHAGEKALAELMQSRGGFEANAQNIRIVTFLEERRQDIQGLNLTRSTLDGLLKYKDVYKKDTKQQKFYYDDNCSKAAVNWASQYSYPSQTTRSFECQTMSWADDVAYAVHDFEDALHGGFIDINTFFDDNLASAVHQEVDGTLKELSKAVGKESLVQQWNWLINMMGQYLGSTPGKTQRDKAATKQLTSELISHFIQNVGRAEEVKTDNCRYHYRLQVPLDIQTRQLLLTKFIELKVMRSYNVQSLEAKGEMMVTKLFGAMTNNPKKLLPEDWRLKVDECNSDDDMARVVCDYISGMTDAFAGKMYARLFIPGSGSIYEPI
jgi:dGTPase